MLSGTAVLEAQVTGKPTERCGNRMPFAQWAPHGAFRCRGTDEWIAIAIQNDEQWAQLVDEMGSPEWARASRFAHASGRKTDEDELERLVAEFTQDQDRYELMQRLQRRRIPAGRVQNAADRCERDPQLNHAAISYHCRRAKSGPGLSRTFQRDFKIRRSTSVGRRAAPRR